MSDFQKRLILRFALVFLFVTAGFCAIIARIIILQTSEREHWLNIEKTQTATEKVVEPKRGNIYDCKGRLLSGSIPAYRLFLDTKAQPLRKDNRFASCRDSIAQALSEVIGEHSKAEYSKILQEAYQKGDRRMKLHKGNLSYTKRKQLMQTPPFDNGFNRYGVYYEEWHRRVRPYGDLAARTIGGTYQQTGRGNSGIEKQFDELLYGEQGIAVEQRVGGRRALLPIKPATDGCDITTTIDAELQDIVDDELHKVMEQTKGEWGCCILMETATGEIKAIANLDRGQDDSYAERVNHAATRMEPGSMFKTISLMAALDDGKVSLTDTFHVYRNGWVYHDRKHPITDSHYIESLKGVMTVKQGLIASSNIVLSKIVTQSYEKRAERFVQKLESMGLRKTFDCEIPGAQTSAINVPNDKETLARMSFGYSVELPPLYTLMFYNAIANNGKMMAPLIVKQISQEEHVIESFKAKTLESSIASRTTIDQVRECLEGVVWDTLGTAARRPWTAKAQSNFVHVAGKTGTARVLQNGRYQTNRHRIAFCGYFPMESPKYTCICVIHDVQHRDAGNDCGGTVRRVAERVMAHHSIELQETDSLSLLPKIKKGLHSETYKVSRALDLGLERAKHRWSSFDDNLQAEQTTVNTETVPNVVGMGAKDAVFAIEQTGMIVSLSGSGRVIRQSIQPGSRPVKGGTVYLELR